MADWAHAPLSKALDVGVLVAHALWRNSGPSVPPSTCGQRSLCSAAACCAAADNRGLRANRLGKQSLAWRFTTANLVLLQTSELVFSLLLIYQFRFLERRMGSAKYSAFVLFATVVGWALRVYLLQSGVAKAIASGPYAFMFACFPCAPRPSPPAATTSRVSFKRNFVNAHSVLLREVPACPTFKVGPFEFSDRSFYYVVGLQLAVASAATRWAAGCGLAAVRLLSPIVCVVESAGCLLFGLVRDSGCLRKESLSLGAGDGVPAVRSACLLHPLSHRAALRRGLPALPRPAAGAVATAADAAGAAAATAGQTHRERNA